MTYNRRRQYTDEFKAEAVRLVVEDGYAVSEAARNLDINANMLRRWRTELSQDPADRRQVIDEKEELRRLREEVRRLKLERDILKKATAFFASESS